MVLYFEWHRTAMDQKSSSGLPMTGEDTGLGALALPLVGYLGKVQERAASLEYCPWCTSKGSTYALRSYRINLQESITLCTNPQCLFPLVSRSLEDVLASLVPEPENATCTDVFASATRLTPAGLLQCSSEAVLTSDAAEVALSHHRVSPDVSEAEDDFCQENSPPEALNRRCSLDSDQSSFAIDSNGINTQSPPHNEQTARTAKKPLTTDSITCKDLDSIKSKTECLSPSRITTQSDELVSSPNHLFWNNCDNLCWLDSMLIALVSCKSLRRFKPKDEPQQSSVWQLMGGYEDVCAATQLHQQTDRDDDVRVPYHVLQKANAELHTLRMSIFKLLQPKLHCKLAPASFAGVIYLVVRQKYFVGYMGQTSQSTPGYLFGKRVLFFLFLMCIVGIFNYLLVRFCSTDYKEYVETIASAASALLLLP
ncbi:hypothetical protein JOQ06_018980 [Pogonophryne albipinna]|uniref:Ubiquitin-specific peptidase-like SUMO isopeptidase domain-containing protein n=1 Tax=Pogonophryne albipinna TaxID=1090488 RepID=A0AAD6ASH0_9TELE|nr:hypothetical protein JOQ06_018980 [Pogonophryne albipinna]